MRELLQKLSKEKIIDFLVEYGKENSDFANAVNVRFGKTEFSEELNKMERFIDIAFSDVGDYYYHDGWGELDFDTSQIYKEIAERLKQGHIRLAFAECSLLYQKYLEVFEYQEECEVADEAESTLELMADIAKKATTTEDKEYIFNECIALCDIDDGRDYGADYDDKLLSIASNFVTKENAAELIKILERYGTGWRANEFKLIHLAIVKKVNGEKVANAFIEENLQYNTIREVAYENSVKNADYDRAEELCIGGIPVPEDESGHYHHRRSPWLYKLYFVYETVKNIEKMSETAERILLCGDLKYYDVLKSLLKKQKLWEMRYSDLLKKCQKLLDYLSYAELLAKEKEYALLFKLAKNHTDLVYRYGKPLHKSFRQETLELFIAKLGNEAASATSRKAYQELCRNISTFKEAGYVSEAKNLVEEFKLTYKKRPAFVDELGKI